MVKKQNISHSKKQLIVYFLLTAMTILVFSQVHQFDFVNIDDNVYVTENFHIKLGEISLHSLRWALSTTYAEFWHPLTWLSLMADYQLYGLNAGGYHVTNLILHILSTLLLFWLFARMTRQIWPCAFVAAFFALHPLHVESVAWVSERKDVLSAFFWMLTLCLYVCYTEKPVIKRYLLVLFSFVLALMSKPMVVTLPLIMILLDYWPLKRFELNKNKIILWQLKEKLPLFLLSGIFSIITIYAQRKPFDAEASFTMASRLANAPVTFVTYLIKTFWPQNMAAIYPFAYQTPFWQTAGASFIIVSVTAIVMVCAKRAPYLLVGWFWYAITIAPVIGIIQVGNQAMADRYTYLSLIGIGFALAQGVPALWSTQNSRRNILYPAAIAFLAIMSMIAWKQCGYWKNSTALCSHMLRATKDNYVAHLNLGSVLFDEGHFKESIVHFNEVIRIRPNLILSYNKRGLAFAKLGQYQHAFEDLNRIILLKPDYVDSYNNRAIIYNNLGRTQQAIADLKKAISLKPDYIDAYNNLGTIYQNLGKHQLALQAFTKAIAMEPDNPLIYYKRGMSFINLFQYQDAILDYKKAITLNPNYFEAYNNQAFIYLIMGQYQLAYDYYSKAISIKPDYADAYNNRAFTLFSMGQMMPGCLEAKKACEMGTCSTLQLATEKGWCH